MSVPNRNRPMTSGSQKALSQQSSFPSSSRNAVTQSSLDQELNNVFSLGNFEDIDTQFMTFCQESERELTLTSHFNRKNINQFYYNGGLNSRDQVNSKYSSGGNSNRDSTSPRGLIKPVLGNRSSIVIPNTASSKIFTSSSAVNLHSQNKDLAKAPTLLNIGKTATFANLDGNGKDPVLEKKFENKRLRNEYLLNNKPQWIMAQQMIQQNFQQQDDEEQEKDAINPVTKMFGNALIIQKIQEIFQLPMNVESGIPISVNLLKSFNIDPQYIEQIKNHQDRRQYIVQMMETKMSQVMRNWEENVSNQDQHYRAQEQKIKQKMETDLSHQQDQFDWLKLPSQNDALKLRFRQLIMQQMNDNKTLILESLKKQGQNLTFKDVPKIDFFQLVEKMNPKDSKYYQILKKQTYSQSTKEQLSEMKLQIQQKEIGGSQTWTIDWDDELENQYLKNKHESKRKFHDQIQSTNWYTMGFMPILQKQKIEKEFKGNRENIMNKYREGQFLTADELKFITDTFEEMNKCIDRKQIQVQVEKLDNQYLETMELVLSEKIIDNYQKLREMIVQARVKYIDKKVAMIRKSFEGQRIGIDQYQQQKDSNFLMRQLQGLMKSQAERVLEGNPIRQQAENNYFVKLFIQCLKDRVYEKIKRRMDYDPFERDRKIILEMKMRQNQLCQKLSVGASQKDRNTQVWTQIHSFHPPSKLPVRQTDFDIVIIDEKMQEKIEKNQNYMSKKINQFQLGVRDQHHVRVADNFKNYLSGGPLKLDFIKYNQFTDTYQVTQDNLQQIIKVQRFFRKIRMKKIIEQIKSQQRQKKHADYISRLKSLAANQDIINAISKRCGFQMNQRANVIYKIPDYQDDEQKLELVFNESYQLYEEQQRIIKQEKEYEIEIQKLRQFDQERKQREEQRLRLLQEINAEIKQNNFDIKTAFMLKADEKMNDGQGNRLETEPSRANMSTQHTVGVNSTPGRTRSIKKKQNTVFSPMFSKINQMGVKLKQKKLLVSAQENTFQRILNSEFQYSEKDVNLKDKFGNTPLFYACQFTNLQFIDWLLMRNANPNQACKNGDTPMHFAMASGNHSKGGTMNSVNNEGLTPIGYATPAVLKYLDLQDGVAKVYKENPFQKGFDNDQLFKKQQKEISCTGQLVIDNFYPLQSPTILINLNQSQ